MQKHQIIPGRPKTGVYLTCETCKVEFYVNSARMRQTARNGNTVRFCSMKCYVKTGDKNPFWGQKHSEETKKRFAENPDRNRFKKGEDNPNFIRFAENNFVGATKGWWKQWFRKNVGECEGCGWKEHPIIIEVHHLDLNTQNNIRENLKFFCPNCHEWWHFTNKSGRYHTNKTYAKRKQEKS